MGSNTSASAIEGPAAVQVLNTGAKSSVLLVCEHASNFIPESFGALGLNETARESHIAWDPGAMAVAEFMSATLDAKLVAATVSRLVYDCNRPPEDPSATPARSETFDVPGNVTLDNAARKVRETLYYAPFRDTLSDVVSASGPDCVLVTIHSFTPVYHGKPRTVEIGILHDVDTRLADAMLAQRDLRDGYVVERNSPYGAEDGVTHTLKVHGLANGLLNVMIEVRNDLIAKKSDQKRVAGILSAMVSVALADLAATKNAEANAC